jgi:hypothetical protein
VVGAGCVRSYYLWKTNQSGDRPWWIFNAYVATVIEVNIAVVCACAPSLKTVTHHLSKTFKSKLGSQESSRDDLVGRNEPSQKYGAQYGTDLSTTKTEDSLKRNKLKKSTRKNQILFTKSHKLNADEDSLVHNHNTHLDVASSAQLSDSPESPGRARPSGPQTPPQICSPHRYTPSPIIRIRPPTADERYQSLSSIPHGLGGGSRQAALDPDSNVPFCPTPGSSAAPSIVFIDNEGETENFIRAKYRKYIETSNTSSTDNITHSFPAMNPGYMPSQPFHHAH